jgi:hypothetical protein
MLVSFLMLLALGTISVYAEDQPIGRVRIADFVGPEQVVPSAVFSVSLDVEYEIRENASIRAAIFGDLGSPIWQSNIINVTGGGDEVWSLNLTAPTTEGTIQYSAYAYYLDNGVWNFYNDTVLGPGLKQVFIKVARDANLQIELGVPGLQLEVGNLSEMTSQLGNVVVPLPIGENYSITVPSVLQLQNSTRLVFDSWVDGDNHTEKVVLLNGDSHLVGSYRYQYLLQVSSTLPSYSYEKWYDAGSNVTIESVESVPMVWPLGSMGLKYVFSGWSGDVNASSVEITFIMDSPKTVDANFTTDYGTLIFPIIISSGTIGAVILVTLKRKRNTKLPTESSASIRVCSNCGGTAEEGWMHCIRCGAILNSPNNSEK